MAHTPGPWRVGESHSLIVFDSTKEEWAVADARTYHGRIAREEAEANARLIAAAPDLLEALKAAVEEGLIPKSSVKDGGANRHSRSVAVADQVRAAIAKAEGRTDD